MLCLELLFSPLTNNFYSCKGSCPTRVLFVCLFPEKKKVQKHAHPKSIIGAGQKKILGHYLKESLHIGLCSQSTLVGLPPHVPFKVCMLFFRHKWHTFVCFFVSYLTQYGGIEVNQGHRVADLQARLQPRAHDEQGDMGAALKHGHLVELAVLHGQLSMVSSEDHYSVVQQPSLP